MIELRQLACQLERSEIVASDRLRPGLGDGKGNSDLLAGIHPVTLEKTAAIKVPDRVSPAPREHQMVPVQTLEHGHFTARQPGVSAMMQHLQIIPADHILLVEDTILQ